MRFVPTSGDLVGLVRVRSSLQEKAHDAVVTLVDCDMKRCFALLEHTTNNQGHERLHRQTDRQTAELIGRRN